MLTNNIHGVEYYLAVAINQNLPTYVAAYSEKIDYYL